MRTMLYYIIACRGGARGGTEVLPYLPLLMAVCPGAEEVQGYGGQQCSLMVQARGFPSILCFSRTSPFVPLSCRIDQLPSRQRKKTQPCTLPIQSCERMSSHGSTRIPHRAPDPIIHLFGPVGKSRFQAVSLCHTIWGTLRRCQHTTISTILKKNVFPTRSSANTTAPEIPVKVHCLGFG